MAQPLPQDSRNFWMLPQNPEESGYYNYGTPVDGAGQYCHPALLAVISKVEYEWEQLDNRRFGVGNISLAAGGTFGEHHSHRSGLEVDVRALRLDGKRLPVTYKEAAYDRAATAKLIELFWKTGAVSTIYFNDNRIPRVVSLPTHDNHFHVEVRA